MCHMLHMRELKVLISSNVSIVLNALMSGVPKKTRRVITDRHTMLTFSNSFQWKWKRNVTNINSKSIKLKEDNLRSLNLVLYNIFSKSFSISWWCYFELKLDLFPIYISIGWYTRMPTSTLYDREKHDCKDNHMLQLLSIKCTGSDHSWTNVCLPLARTNRKNCNKWYE